MSPILAGTTVKSIDINFNCTYLLTSEVEVYIDSNSIDGATWVPFETSFIEGKKIGVVIGASSPYIEFVSIDPHEDDNYIYKPFSTYLKVGDNGEFGKNLYQYLDGFLPNVGDESSISEIPQIQEITIQHPTSSSVADRFQREYARVMKRYDGGILFSLDYILYEDGRVSRSKPT